MKPHIQAQVDGMADMTIGELRDKYAEVFGEPTRSRHKVFLRKRITWGLQARDEGGLSERARQRAQELANEADLRLTGPKSHTEVRPFRPTRDRRLPMPGAVITREFKGATIAVTVLDAGFLYRGETFRSLSAVARAITGTRWNGLLFFGLTKKEIRA